MSRTILTADTIINVPLNQRQDAWDDAFKSIDLAGYTLSFQLDPGTYTDNLSVCGRFVGQARNSNVKFIGDETNWDNVLIQPLSGHGFDGFEEAGFHVSGCKIVAPVSGIFAQFNSIISYSKINFGACGVGHIEATKGGRTINLGDYKYSGDADSHLYSTDGGTTILSEATLTAIGNRTFRAAFVKALQGARNTTHTMHFAGPNPNGMQWYVKQGSAAGLLNNYDPIPGSLPGDNSSGYIL